MKDNLQIEQKLKELELQSQVCDKDIKNLKVQWQQQDHHDHKIDLKEEIRDKYNQ